MIDDTAGVVRLSGKLLCASVAETETVKKNLPEHMRLTLEEPGCLSFKVSQTEDDPLIWNVEESFINASAFQHHQKRTRASAWWDATANITRSYNVTGLEPS